MQKAIKELLFSGIVLLGLDGMYIGSNLDTYNNVIKEIQGSPLKWRGIGAVLFCYLCLIGGLYYFILREKRSIIDAFLFGIVVYGVYATTVFTMFKGYPAYLAIIDIVWGGILMATTTWITHCAVEYMV